MTTKTRRTIPEYIAALKANVDRHAERYDNAVAKLEKVEHRYAKHLQLAELDGRDPAELTAELAKTKAEQKLLRLALKAKKAAGSAVPDAF